jgi:aryl-alcohol dehydrogenase-like predicted oxidoreductase
VCLRGKLLFTFPSGPILGFSWPSLVWNHLHRYDDVLWSINNSLERMKLDYVDLFLVHWPIVEEITDTFTDLILIEVEPGTVKVTVANVEGSSDGYLRDHQGLEPPAPLR